MWHSGLLVGKTVGVSGFTLLATRLGLSTLPAGVSRLHVVGVSIVAGIGFTVALFVTALAFNGSAAGDEAKIGVLVASLVAAVVGLIVLRLRGTAGHIAALTETRTRLALILLPMVSAASPKRVVIVESPTKAATIARFLDDSYTVESSRGHIRDLPTKASEIPKAYQRGVLGAARHRRGQRLQAAVRAEQRQARARCSELKKLVATADELYLATDEDREGEAIAWHLLEVLSPPSAGDGAPVGVPRDHPRRNPGGPGGAPGRGPPPGGRAGGPAPARPPVRLRGLAGSLEEGGAAPVRGAGAERGHPDRRRARAGADGVRPRRLLVVGASPPQPAPGRASSWPPPPSTARRLATGRDFGADGKPATDGVLVLDEATARRLAAALDGADAEVVSVASKPYRRRPAAPFITSTLQQEAGRRLRLSASAVMQVAQSLYEQGFITYMRTDSVTLADVALKAARAEVARRYGEEFLPAGPRRYASKVRNAQEAHEAIRPAGDTFASPESLRARLSETEAKLYELIWRRTLASQMTDTTGETVTIEALAAGEGGAEVTLAASGTVIAHEGFRRAWDPVPVPGSAANGSDGSRRGARAAARGSGACRSSPRASRWRSRRRRSRATRPSRRRASPRPR